MGGAPFCSSSFDTQLDGGCEWGVLDGGSWVGVLPELGRLKKEEKGVVVFPINEHI